MWRPGNGSWYVRKGAEWRAALEALQWVEVVDGGRVSRANYLMIGPVVPVAHATVTASLNRIG